MQDLPIPALLSSAKLAAAAELQRGLAEQGHEAIRESHGCVFAFIELEGSRLTFLARQSGLTKQAVGEVVDHLQRLGYVERVPDPTDGRAKIVRLTDQGLEARKLSREILDRVERGWARELGEERVAALRSMLEELHSLTSGRTPSPA